MGDCVAQSPIIFLSICHEMSFAWGTDVSLPRKRHFRVLKCRLRGMVPLLPCGSVI